MTQDKVDDVFTATEQEIESATKFMMERAKQVGPWNDFWATKRLAGIFFRKRLAGVLSWKFMEIHLEIRESLSGYVIDMIIFSDNLCDLGSADPICSSFVMV